MINNKFHIKEKSKVVEALLYPLLVVILMWTIFFIDKYFQLGLFKYGVRPRSFEGLKGILFMPFIHGQKDYSHIFNNTIPILVLLSALIYFYRQVALKVIIVIWIGTGAMLWYIGENLNSYHIGMSGVIYGLFGYLFISGFLIKNKSVQAISMGVAFIYGSLIWGIFPTEEAISWEGHLSGLLIGILLAFVFRRKGPEPDKYRYEFEDDVNESRYGFEYWKIKPNGEQIENSTEEEENINNTTQSVSDSVEVIYNFKKKENKNEN